MKILISGFEAFGGSQINPTEIIARAINSGELNFDEEPFKHHEIRAVVLPVSYRQAFASLKKSIDDFKPDAVIALGQAAGRAQIEMEKVAVNFADSSIADNDGVKLTAQRLHENSREAFFSTLPIEKIQQTLRSNEIPVGLSLSAGAYVCNALFFDLQEWGALTTVKTGFVHVPLIQEQLVDSSDQRPAIEIAELKRALKLIVEAVILSEH